LFIIVLLTLLLQLVCLSWICSFMCRCVVD